MSNPEKYVPKHRAPGAHKLRKETPKRVLRKTFVMTGVAVAATGVAVSGGMVSGTAEYSVADAPVTGGAADQAEQSADRGAEIAAERVADREVVVTRAERRKAVDPARKALLSTAPGPATAREESLDDADPRDIAKALLPEYGFDASQFSCLDQLYVSESNWRIDADNPTSSAYGIPQALTQTHDLPEGYMTSAEVQIRWGLEYIASRYGTPCSAWGFKAGNGWY